MLDLWFEKRYRRQCEGRAYLTRFADDFVAAFQRHREAVEFERAVRARFAEFGLELAEEKTRLLPFGRVTWVRPGERLGTFEFLGFKHVIGRDRKGRFAVIRIPSTKSCRKFLDRVWAWLKRHRHTGRPRQQAHLRAMLRGFYQYFGLHKCVRKLKLVRYRVVRLWVKALRQLSQRHRFTWARLNRRTWFDLPQPRTLHPNV